MDITQEFLISRFEYVEETGDLIYKYDVAPMAKKGQIAGSSDGHGYIKIGLFGRRYMAHRLIWIYKTGSSPEGDIDHIDGSRRNNRWANLRSATRSQNLCNLPGRSASGVKGVYFNKKTGRWTAQIRLHGRSVYQAYFKTLGEAEKAVTFHREQFHGEFARHE